MLKDAAGSNARKKRWTPDPEILLLPPAPNPANRQYSAYQQGAVPYASFYPPKGPCSPTEMTQLREVLHGPNGLFWGTIWWTRKAVFCLETGAYRGPSRMATDYVRQSVVPALKTRYLSIHPDADASWIDAMFPADWWRRRNKYSQYVQYPADPSETSGGVRRRRHGWWSRMSSSDNRDVHVESDEDNKIWEKIVRMGLGRTLSSDPYFIKSAWTNVVRLALGAPSVYDLPLDVSMCAHSGVWSVDPFIDAGSAIGAHVYLHGAVDGQMPAMDLDVEKSSFDHGSPNRNWASIRLFNLLLGWIQTCPGKVRITPITPPGVAGIRIPYVRALWNNRLLRAAEGEPVKERLGSNVELPPINPDTPALYQPLAQKYDQEDVSLIKFSLR